MTQLQKQNKNELKIQTLPPLQTPKPSLHPNHIPLLSHLNATHHITNLQQSNHILPYINDTLSMQNQDNFAIGQQDQINIGRTSINLQLKQTFNILRQSIQKLLNQEELSISIVHLLPKQLQDDFHDFMSYIKQKIQEIKNQNFLSFIAAEAGSEPQIQDLSIELKDFINKQSESCMNLKRVLTQKQSLITSLMNQKTQQQNTINQHQTIQQQVQKLHIQQYETLKKQIKFKNEQNDRQIVYYQSLKNMLKKMMQMWIQDDDNYDDFSDNLKMFTNIYKLNSKERQLMQKYLEKYAQLKNIE